MNIRRRFTPPSLAPLSAEFLDDVLRIERATFEAPWSRAAFVREIVEPRSHFFCLLVNDRCAGYGGFWQVVDEMHISNIALALAHRGQGYGRWLVAALLRRAVVLGLSRAALEVREHNAAAQQLYRSLGFVVDGCHPNYYAEEGEDALLMWNDDLDATVAGLPPGLGEGPAEGKTAD